MRERELSFEYEIRLAKRARQLRISVHRDGRVVVAKPKYIPEFIVRRFVKNHADWIEKKIAEFKTKPVPLLGQNSKREYKTHKEAALSLVCARIAEYNQYYNYEVAAVRIGNQRSRWGSCSAKKNLNFNYKIIFLPTHIQDYVVVHELCHLKEMNHSPRFWALVAEQIPDWKIVRRELKKY